jgi:uncharacterized repeat protein (TIGR01451 family)
MFQSKQRSSPGQALVEFALIIGILLLFVFVIIESGRAFQAWLTVQNAAREGARFAITGQFDIDCLNDPLNTIDMCRVTAVEEVARQGASGLVIRDSAGEQEPNFFHIQVFGFDPTMEPNASGVCVPSNATPPQGCWGPTAGVPGYPVAVRVVYRLPVITPLLRPIAESIRVMGQVVMNNENYDQTHKALSGAMPPMLPPLPTLGPDPTPPPCPIHIVEPTLLASDTAVTISGQIGVFVALWDLGPVSNPHSTPVKITADRPLAPADFGSCNGGYRFNDSEIAGDLDGLRNYSEHIIVVQSPDDTSIDNRFIYPVAADVWVTQTDIPDPVVAGSTLLYAVTMGNAGPVAATGVVLTATLDSTVTFVDAVGCLHAGADANGRGGYVRCELSDPVERDTTRNFDLRVRPDVAGRIHNVATVTADQEDPNPANNLHIEGTDVAPLAIDLEVFKTGPAQVVVGERLEYALRVVNNSQNTAATGIVLQDILPSQTTFNSITASQGGTCFAPVGGVLRCEFDSLAPRAEVTATLRITPTAVGPITNWANVMGNEADPDLTNNSRAATTTVLTSGSDAYINLTQTCGNPGSQIAVNGYNWPTQGNHAISIYWHVPNGLLLGTVANNPANWTTSVTVPITATNGTYDIVAVRRPDGQHELLRTTLFHIPCPAPDLVAGQPAVVGELPVLKNTPVTFTVMISNTGVLTATEVFPVSLYFDPQPVPSGTTTHISSAYKVATTNVNGLGPETSRILTFTVPSGFSGPYTSMYTHTVYAVVDSDPGPHGIVLNEASETNNVSPPLLVPVIPPAPADLIISQPVLSNTLPIAEYQPVDFSVVITNAGHITVSSQFFVGLYFNPSPAPVSSSTHISQEFRTDLVSVSSLGAGMTRTLALRAGFGFQNPTPGTPFTHTVYAVVDAEPPPTGSIAEPNETNNISSPLLVPVNPGIPPSPTATPPPGTPGSMAGVARVWINGQMVQQYNVLVTAIDSYNRTYQRYTNSDGVYYFQSLPPETYTVTGCINIDGISYFGSYTGAVVQPGENLIVNLFLFAGPCS